MFALHRYIFSVFGIYHIWSAQIRDIHDLIFKVWDIPILVLTSCRYPWFNLWRLGNPKTGLHWSEISMVHLCSKQINMGQIWDIFARFFRRHVTLQPYAPYGACASQRHAYGGPSEAQFDAPLCLPLKAPQVEACPSQTARATGSLRTHCFPFGQ